MFEMAISITKVMPPINTSSAGRTVATRSAASGCTLGIHPRRVGYW